MNLATWSRSSLALAGTAAGGEEELEEEEEEGRAPSLSARADAVVEFVVEFTFEDGRSTPSRTLPLLLPSAFFFKNRIVLTPSTRLVGVGGAIGEEGGAGEGASSQACLRRQIPQHLSTRRLAHRRRSFPFWSLLGA